MTTSVISGARALFVIDGKLVAYASGVNGGEEVQYEPIDVIGKLRVLEWVPVAYRVNLSANMFRTIGDSKTGRGSLKSIGLFPFEKDILSTDAYDSVVITDVVTKAIIASIQGVKSATYNYSISARGVVGQDVSFVCLGMQDESEIPIT